jgi:molybdopterin-guanine dinucleotide biosynthesis protein A
MSRFSQVGAFILAGGKSSRMGTDKALLRLGGGTFVARAAQKLDPLAAPIIAIGPASLGDEVSMPVIEDKWTGCGPLGGIATALESAEQPWNLVLACDLPYLTEEWLRYIIGCAVTSSAQVVMAANENGWEPLCAVYHRSIAARLAAKLEKKVRRVTEGLDGLAVHILPPSEWKKFDPDGRLFKNVNTPEDYAEARAFFEGGRNP